MPQSLVQIYVHIIFSTKDREPFLRDLEIRERVHAYLATVCQNQNAPSLRVGGVEDHVHLVCRMSKVMAIAEFVKALKRDSSQWIKTLSPDLREFYWQSGYGAFSVSPSHVDPLLEYVRNQEEHHRKESFQDEFRRICEKYGVPLDERYVWD